MKKTIIILICLSLSALTASADSGWGIFGSYWSPADGDTESGPGVRIAFELIPGMQLDLRASYFDNVMDKDKGPDLEVIPVETGLALYAPVADKVNVYGGIGAGYYFLDSDIDVDNSIGLFVNGGLEFDVFENAAAYGGTRASLFAEAMYRSVNADIGGTGKDIDLDGLVVNAGLMMRW